MPPASEEPLFCFPVTLYMFLLSYIVEYRDIRFQDLAAS